MEKYRFLEHIADAKFQAFGKTLEEAFGNAALALTSIMIDPEKIEPKIEKKISVEGMDLKALLYNWLEQFLILLDSEFFLLGKVKEMKIKKNKEKYSLKAIVIGDKASEKYKTTGDVKAVTYMDMEIKEKKPFMVQVVVDI